MLSRTVDIIALGFAAVVLKFVNLATTLTCSRYIIGDYILGGRYMATTCTM